MRKVPVEEAVGLTLGYDITKIVPGREKYRAFRRGQVIGPEDIPKLKDIGKEHIYIWDPDDDMVHEDDAALRLAQCAAGPGLYWGEPNQGRVNLKAEYAGLLKVQVDGLNMLNNLEDIVFATLHNDRVVVEGQTVAGTRVVPVAVEQKLMQEAEKICTDKTPILSVKPFKPLWTAVVTTGTEVNSGRIKDGFAGVIRNKIAPYSGRWMGQVIVPDDPELISLEIHNFVAEGAQLVIVTGGMSVDADDATPQAIRKSGAEVVFYGAPILPGSQFMLAYQGHVPICGVPGGALFSRKTTLDLLLPRIFAEDRIERSDIVAMGHGGLCEECKQCHFPQCPFGKTTVH
ncbi:MAG: molybdopterin-binding protein [Syntrophomonadaceae bacterium]|nr:molybdopterin-binding protein [Syntrophomonadaceae bacterium]